MSITPMFASEATAAKLLDMRRTQFADLVRLGALPPPCAHGRWDVDELKAIMRGDKAKPKTEFEF